MKVFDSLGLNMDLEEQKRRLAKVEVGPEEELDELRFCALLEACGVVLPSAPGEKKVWTWGRVLHQRVCGVDRSRSCRRRC